MADSALMETQRSLEGRLRRGAGRRKHLCAGRHTADGGANRICMRSSFCRSILSSTCMFFVPNLNQERDCSL